MVRLLSPLRPQSPARVRWETDVTEALAARWECTYGDASAFLDAHPVEVDELFAAGALPGGAAETLDLME